jgi:hypothetical protein
MRHSVTAPWQRSASAGPAGRGHRSVLRGEQLNETGADRSCSGSRSDRPLRNIASIRSESSLARDPYADDPSGSRNGSWR